MADRVESIKLGEVVGRRLAALQRERGVRDSDLARLTGISNAYFSRLKAGKYDDPGVGMLISIANALGVQPAELVGDQLRTLELPMPAPAAYFAAQFGVTRPDHVRAVEEFARRLAELAQGKAQIDEQPSSRQRKKSVLSDLTYRLFGQVLEEDEGKAAFSAEGDPQLDQVLAGWYRLAPQDRDLLASMLERLLNPRRLAVLF